MQFEESGQLNEAIATRRHMGWNGNWTNELESALRERGATGYWRVRNDELAGRRTIGSSPARPTDIAWTYVHLGEPLRALEWLERAVEERDGWVIYMKVEPPFASLRSDPRFQKITRAAGLPVGDFCISLKSLISLTE